MFWQYKDLKLAYSSVGSGIPVLLLHGFSLDHRVLSGCMEPIFGSPSFKDRYRRIYPDLPGMGQTRAVPWIRDANDLLDVLLRFIREVIGKEPFILMGQSYGGYLARGVVGAIPSQIRACIFLCPCVIPDKSARALPEFRVTEKSGGEWTDAADRADFQSSMAVQTPRTWQRYEEEIMSGIRLADEEYLRNYQENGYAFSFPVDRVSVPYSFPALFLAGRQDQCVGYQDAWNILENYSGAAFVVLNGAGHMLQIDQEDPFQQTIACWLRSLEEKE